VSKVPDGSCGSSIDYYSLNVGSSTAKTLNNTYTIAPIYEVQIVRIAAPSLSNELFFTTEDATGYFTLSYDGTSTQPISSHASSTDLRDALEALPSIETLSISRSLSLEQLTGTVSATPGSSTLSCSSICDFSELREGDIVSVNSLWFKVSLGYSFANTPNQIPLALYNDSSIVTFYNGPLLSIAPIFRWARGFEWTITFLSVSTTASDGTPIVLPLSSSQAELNPIDSSISIRPQDCVNCFYINQLTVWNLYYLQLRAHNVNGFGPFALTTGTPKEVPGPPTSVIADVVSGTQIELFFGPPAGYNSDIIQYTVQWDTNDSFSNVYAGGASCASSGYGQCQLSGITIAGNPPFDYLVNYLTIDTLYYLRVSAANSVSPPMENFPTENVRWSAVVSVVTANQVPQVPRIVTVVSSGLTSLQVYFFAPTGDGGLPIISYTISWDASPLFTDPSTYGQVTISVNDISVLNTQTGQLIYQIQGLVTGTYYWVQVTATNSVGDSIPGVASGSAQPGGKPNAPDTVAIALLAMGTAPITRVSVMWSPPSGLYADGGSSITGYLIEWWTSASVDRVQLIQYRTKTYPLAQIGQFTLTFSPNPDVKLTSNPIPWTVSAANFRSELLDMGYSSYLNFTQLYIGDVSVSQSIIPSKGYQWTM
jgi:hypothetical protein